MREYAKNMKKYVENMKKYEENMKEYEEIGGKLENSVFFIDPS